MASCVDFSAHWVWGVSLRLSFEGLLCSLPLESSITLEQEWPWTLLDLGYYTAAGPPTAVRPDASISSFIDWAYYDPFLPPKLLGGPKEIAMTRPTAHCLAHVRHLTHHGTSLRSLAATHHGIWCAPGEAAGPLHAAYTDFCACG